MATSYGLACHALKIDGTWLIYLCIMGLSFYTTVSAQWLGEHTCGNGSDST
jgi:hypothetical protein